MNFIKNVFSTVIGIFVFLILSFFLIILLGAIFGGSDKIEVKKDSVLELDLSKVSFDYAGQYEEPNPLEKLINSDKVVGFTEVLTSITAAKEDKNIKGITLVDNFSSIGMAQMKELRDKLIDFKKSKKFIYSYANSYSQREYYLSSVSDKIYLNPIGDIDFRGLAAELLFFKDFQDKTGMKFEIIRHGKYKSAVEPYLLDKMSPENREQYSVLLNSIWKEISTDIANSRSISIDQVNQIADGLLARNSKLALENKLIDKIAYIDEFKADINKILKVKKDEEYETISLTDYSTTLNSDLSAESTIAIVYAQGEINSGEGDVDYIGEGSINRALKEAREEEDVKAVVLRVNSPGGSALTSELIWREIELTKKVKPVVVSMGNYAASGGYYISAGANYIFAEPTTLTGSIGVFGMYPNLNGIATKWGVNAEQITTHKNAVGYSVFEPISEEFKVFALEGVDDIYKTFVNKVTQGRKMTFEQVDAIGQGRVWTGTDAIKIGLVDKIGNLDDAIKKAAELGKAKEYKTESFPIYKKDASEWLSDLTGAKTKEAKAALIKEEIGEEGYAVLQRMKKMNNRKGIQALMPFEIIF